MIFNPSFIFELVSSSLLGMTLAALRPALSTPCDEIGKTREQRSDKHEAANEGRFYVGFKIRIIQSQPT